MEVSNPNNVKIYNLSSGKTLPEWISGRKRRQLQKKDVDIRRRIQLIQDFEMPDVSDCIKISRDGQYIVATGTYKPRVRCYDVKQLSMKFERGFDSEVVKFEFLSDDYSKLVFLQNDRYLEFHVASGRWCRLRIPKFGRDISYHPFYCDLYTVGASSEIYRINLEQGRFLPSLQTDSSSINVVQVNDAHYLVFCGTKEGRVEAWDARSNKRVACLDCALNSVRESTKVIRFPSVTSLAFRDGLSMAVGTATGQILLYDIRSNKPFLVKDHMYGYPIKDIEFHKLQDIVISMDNRIAKFWNSNTGKLFTSLQSESGFNDLCIVPNSGLIFIANDDKKILSYYMPELGPAPKWCSFLDNLTEELEESRQDIVYDNYKFVSEKELSDLGLSHLIGTNLLRAYMHGYFMDLRLYHKTKSLAEPYAYAEYRKKKIKEKIEAERGSRVKINKLPQVNKEYAEKLQQNKEENKHRKKNVSNVLDDSRFEAMFKNVDFEINKESDEFKLLHPILSKSKRKQKFQTTKEDEEEEGVPSSDEESSSDDEHEWIKKLKEKHHLVKQKKDAQDNRKQNQPKFYELKDTKASATLGELLEQIEDKPVRNVGDIAD